MTRFCVALILFFVCLNADESQPPKAKRIKKEMTIHDHTRTDYYYWMRDRESQEVKDYLHAENAYVANVMSYTKDFQEQLFQEITGRIPQTDESVPYFFKGYYYYSRFAEGQEYPIFCRKKDSLENKEQILINANELAKGHSYYRAAGLKISPDNSILAFAEDTLGRRKYTIRFKNLQTGKIRKESIANTTGSIVWANDNKTLYYTVKDAALRAHKIMQYQLGSEEHKEVFHEKDTTFSTWVYKSKSQRFIIIGSYSTLSQEYRVMDADKPGSEFHIIQPRKRNLEYSIAHYEDKFYILSNDKAQNFRLMSTPLDKTTMDNWSEVIPHRQNVLLENIEIFADYLVVQERKDGLTHLHIVPWNEKQKDYYIDFGEETYSVGLDVNLEFNTTTLRYNYTSLTTPNSVVDFDMKSKSKNLLKQREVVGGYDTSLYKAERMYATARDGVKVPISLVYKKNLRKKHNPLLLYAYGSYGYSMDVYFSSTRLSLLDRGVIFAIAHIRGGQEMGRHWYEDGKLLKKKNTFTDFIDCGKFLINKQYTTKDLLFAEGGSAGGLLMGAVANMSPQTFKGILASVPFVDVVTTMLDDSIPLTTGEYDEWGNPNIKKYYDYMLSYSPYDQVKAQDYPAMLITTGFHDSQVQYWEPAKWVAKLRHLKTNNNVLLFDTDMTSGHSGASGRFQRYRSVALEYAFLFHLLGQVPQKN
ncbi:S9 family peptidase [Candidatus Uabimicrobium sp. HlEnr_7]|uniref:S9 family peptidase n=1 Tax=Candidatus Uabimicrobium helgolandensis TaxID=3095367 RepID=UPI003558DE32